MDISATPLVEYFTIRRLNGFKDVTVSLGSRCSIFVAENGSGKTTILSALNAFLTCRFARLRSIEFELIECKFSSVEEVLILRRDQISPDQGEESLDELSRDVSASRRDIIDFVTTHFNGTFPSVMQHPLGNRMYYETEHTQDSIVECLSKIKSSLEANSEYMNVLRNKVSSIVGDVQIVYLPTYRRIELPLTRRPVDDPRARLRRTHWPESPVRRKTKFSDVSAKGINFGLSDVEDRLQYFSEQIERRSNAEYRAISATIVDDLLRSNVSAAAALSEPLPDLDALKLFLSRVSRDRKAEASIDALKGLYMSGKIDSNSADQNVFLRYFLGRLNKVIDQTQKIEKKLEQFVEACNKYLKLSSDEKELSYDQESMKVIVKNLWSKKNIELDDLSSGEKQIISLMAILYLYDTTKFIMVDEPELSLSLEWQRRILPDVLLASSVCQLLAITHSPFIFDNDLDSCAAPLMVVRYPSVEQ